MLLCINFESGTPIYEQIRNQIIEGIASKKLLPGESLPSVRQLASDIGVNMHTVNKAYSRLKQDGLIVIHKRQGVLVAASERMRATQPDFSPALRPIVAEAVCRGQDLSSLMEGLRSVYMDITGGKDNG
jgi:GntR family transcriptional regulator